MERKEDFFYSVKDDEIVEAENIQGALNALGYSGPGEFRKKWKIKGLERLRDYIQIIDENDPDPQVTNKRESRRSRFFNKPKTQLSERAQLSSLRKRLRVLEESLREAGYRDKDALISADGDERDQFRDLNGVLENAGVDAGRGVIKGLVSYFRNVAENSSKYKPGVQYTFTLSDVYYVYGDPEDEDSFSKMKQAITFEIYKGSRKTYALVRCFPNLATAKKELPNLKSYVGMKKARFTEQ